MSRRLTLPERLVRLEDLVDEIARRLMFSMQAIHVQVSFGSPLDLAPTRQRLSLLEAYERTHRAKPQDAQAIVEGANANGSDPGARTSTPGARTSTPDAQ